MDCLKIIIPGMLSTVQDEGRTGHMAFGFSQCGAMDTDSMYLANILVGNGLDEAVIEMTLTGISAIACEDIFVSVTGGAADVFVNGEKAEENRALRLKKGDYITIGQISCGLRCYLAVRGGITVEKEMGSRSTFLKIGMGGFKGRKLEPGDVLPTKESSPIKNLNKRVVKPEKQNLSEIRAVLGPQGDMFSKEEADNFFKREYKVTPASDRMGIRLFGDMPIKPLKGSDIVSDGIALGAVQVPKNGQPIILCADRQTTGGYAKIATVISSDMPKCAQMTPGQTFRFKKVSVEEAQKIRKEKMLYFSKLKKQMR